MNYRSKTAATWLAITLGTLGAHRFYLRGTNDKLGWLHPLPTMAGLVGALRMKSFGVDDRLAWLLIPILGLMITQAMLHAIVYGLTPDEKWDARHNPGQPGHATRWAPVLGVIAALMIGGAVLMGTIAFVGEKAFELELEKS
jgi:glycerol uptake facilitator-like aquaporin